MRILLLDIETFPNKGYFWRTFKENIGIDQIVEPGYTACWSAKWYGNRDVYYSSLNESSELDMVSRIHSLLAEADVVIHYNGKKFDIPTLNKEFLKLGLTPPAPFRQVDLYQTVRSNFKFASNKLDFVCQQLGLGTKTHHKGFDLWKGCMNNDAESWSVMKEYNINDVFLLERLYDKLIPWIKNPPNHNLYSDISCCPSCGGVHYQKRGFTNTIRQRQRYQCTDCGAWFQDRNGYKQREVVFNTGAN